ncbi:bifunctional Leucine carboxyl methyltransferase 1/S-adenosyl-L-methionine-dependent methyltransferase superfamily/Methyltransferase Ppm1-Ppm2-Tcmp [Babesia duncani]|uniref:[phosphatase 2A protein]-leucine-carboxy methyltransferase n=1 Tax=Babesia duncani TaxID=323732 RepID=A0AAD9PLT9_9APIC|nr:bifunctional Leucine carboxyl methyltransferase 1/S-adenosyl-L-methionine-dependent methyltransferase superfamily/Methyltransferase Ppm1-Ppm2-Tcmp [Babesia duncani]
MKSIRDTIDTFVATFPNEDVQFVNLGAGLDTVGLWAIDKHERLFTFELDFLKQLFIINKLRNVSIDKDGLIQSDRFRMVPADLTNIGQVEKLKNYGFSCSRPSIFLSECSLVYVDPKYGNKVQCNDRFGEALLERFKMYGLQLLATNMYPTAQAQIKRFKDLGWERVIVINMNDVYNYLLTTQEKHRIRVHLQHVINAQKLECLDEIEELVLICSHYVLGVAAANGANVLEPIFQLFERKDIPVENYTTSQMREMIAKGQLHVMQPPLLKMDPTATIVNEPE